MKKIKILICVMVLCASYGYAQDWSEIPVPVKLEQDMAWELQDNLSDSFNYSGKEDEFHSKWQDKHIHGWLGPGLTEWKPDHSEVCGGNLVLHATRKPNTNKVYCGFVTAKHTVKYPVYMEVSMKVSGLKLASNFWVLSDDDRNELDVTETYGNDDFLGRRMSTNYHIFNRDSVTNNILEDYGHVQQLHGTDNNALFRNAFHRFGMYWKDATHVEFYLDGKLVRTLTTENELKDPEGKFLDRPMRIILDTEDHVWRSNKGITPTDGELDNNDINKVYYDWIRVYKPVVKLKE